MDVDQEIDELISDSPPRKPIPTPQDDTPDSTCRWNSCDKPFDDPKSLGEHVAAGKSGCDRHPPATGSHT